jgi:hypothetical protein
MFNIAEIVILGFATYIAGMLTIVGVVACMELYARRCERQDEPL